jgi:hypothetical protein
VDSEALGVSEAMRTACIRPSLLCESARTLEVRTRDMVEQLGAEAAAAQLRRDRSSAESRRTPGNVLLPPTEADLKRRRRREINTAKANAKPSRRQGEIISH